MNLFIIAAHKLTLCTEEYQTLSGVVVNLNPQMHFMKLGDISFQIAVEKQNKLSMC